MTQGERVREIRKELGLTLEKFGEVIGLKKNSVSQIENDKNGLTDSTAKAICREFHVNYYWLTEEKGDKFTATPESVVNEIAEEYNLDEMDKKIIEKYLELSDEHRKVIKEYLQSIFN